MNLCRFGFFRLLDGFVAGVEIQHSSEGKVEADGEHQGMSATLALVLFCEVRHRKNFDWLIERSNKSVNELASKKSFSLIQNIC